MSRVRLIHGAILGRALGYRSHRQAAVLEHGRLIKQLKGAEVTENDVSSLLVSS